MSFDASGNQVAAGPRDLPASTIYGFNGQFPGPMINAEYGKPALVRFVNKLDEDEKNLDRQDFGAPDYSFLTHLHNGHTAPESDGNPRYSMNYGPEQPRRTSPVSGVDNLYLNWPAGVTTERSRASSGSTITAWITPAPTSTREWSGCTRSTTRGCGLR